MTTPMTRCECGHTTPETLCADCGERCDPNYRGQEWGEWRDGSGTLRPVHKWCFESWAEKQRPAPSPTGAAAGAMSDERWRQIVQDWEEREPGFYACENNRRMAAMQELIREVRRLRAAPVADSAGQIGEALHRALVSTDEVTIRLREPGEYRITARLAGGEVSNIDTRDLARALSRVPASVATSGLPTGYNIGELTDADVPRLAAVLAPLYAEGSEVRWVLERVAASGGER